MYKTIIAVVAFLVIALTVQLYVQDRVQRRIAREQQETGKLQSDNQAKAEADERDRQRAAGIDSDLEAATDSIVPDSFSVATGAPMEFSVTVNAARMKDVTVSGHFAVSGAGSGSIEVYLFGEDDYANWIDGNSSTAIYASGPETAGDVRASIGQSGRYYLVFRNAASSTALTVRSDIKMQYEKRITPS